MGNIISMIWELPWYQVLVVAAADDVILLLKLWWVPVLFVVFFGTWFLLSEVLK